MDGQHYLPIYYSQDLSDYERIEETYEALTYKTCIFLLQTSLTAPPGECDGSGKPRVRARRGQATDPHSIAERVRNSPF